MCGGGLKRWGTNDANETETKTGAGRKMDKANEGEEALRGSWVSART